MSTLTNASFQKLNALQALRGLAFIGVICEHTRLIETGAFSVSIFFVLSGFLMTYSYYHRSIKSSFLSGINLAWNKISKLYPLHIITLIAAIPFRIESSNEIFTIEFTKKFFLNLFLLQSWSPDPNIHFSFNAVSWYLSTSVLLYIMFPFIYKLLKRYTNYLHAYAGIVFALVIQILFAFLTRNIGTDSFFIKEFSKWFTYIFPLFRLGDFFIGCNLGYLFLSRKTDISHVSTTLLELLTCLLSAFVLFLYNKKISIGEIEWIRYTLLFTVCSLLLIYLFASEQGYISKLITTKLLIYIGNISSYGFIIHSTIIRVINKFFLTPYAYIFSPLNLTILTLILTCILCTLIAQLPKLFSASLIKKQSNC